MTIYEEAATLASELEANLLNSNVHAELGAIHEALSVEQVSLVIRGLRFFASAHNEKSA